MNVIEAELVQYIARYIAEELDTPDEEILSLMDEKSIVNISTCAIDDFISTLDLLIKQAIHAYAGGAR